MRLLERTTRRVSLAAFGREFDRKVQQLLDDLDATLLGIRGVAATRMGEVTIACVPSTVYYYLSAVIRRYHERYPKIRVKVFDVGANDVLVAVARGEADFGLNFIGSQERDIEFKPLLEERFVAACRRDHALAKKRKVSWAELAAYDFIAVSKASGNRLLLDQALAGLPGLPQSIYEAQHVTTLLALVEAGLGVAAVPSMAMPGADHPLLVSVPLFEPIVTRKVGLIRRKARTPSPAAQQLYEFFAQMKGKRGGEAGQRARARIQGLSARMGRDGRVGTAVFGTFAGSKEAFAVTMTITFDDPPLNEVALGRTFLPRPDFLVPHFGAFWEQVRDQFPNVAHAPPIVTQNDPMWSEMPLPRVWLLSADSTTLLQLQQDRFHYNWRQTDEKKAYVRFPAIQAEWLRLWALLQEFVLRETGQPLQPIGAELTYVNFIAVEDAKDAFEIAETSLQDSVWSRQSRFLPAPSGFAHNYSFDLPNGIGVLQTSAAAAQRKGGASVLKLELTVRGKHSEEIPFEQWSTEAHDYLVAAFKDLTKPSMHAVWKLREG